MSHIANLQIKKIRDEQAFRDRFDQNRRDLQFASILNANVDSEMRADEKRNLRLLTIEAQERSMNDMINKRDRDNGIRKEEEAQEIRIAEEMQKLKLEKLKDDKLRQHIRETSVELRELEGKLRAGYTQKERMAQLAEKEALKFDETSRDAEIYKRMQEESKQSEVLKTQMNKLKYEENVRYQQELERQLEDKEMRRQEEYQETLNDKLMIDEIVRKIYEEDQRAREREAMKKELVKKYIAEFMEHREGWKNLEKDRLDAENQKIAEFAALQAEREGKRQLARVEAEELRTELISKLSAKIEGDRREREEMEQIRQDLYEEEQEEKERIKEQQRVDKRRHDMYELQRMEREQKEFKAMRKRAQYEEEQLFKQQMLCKFAEDDRIEQMNAQKRRMKQLEHKRAVENLMMERRDTFAKDRERDLEERRREDEIIAFRKRVIEEERQRMLREHAPNLLGYLPKGVIQDRSDLDKLGNDFKDYYKPRPSNPFNCDI